MIGWLLDHPGLEVPDLEAPPPPAPEPHPPPVEPSASAATADSNGSSSESSDYTEGSGDEEIPAEPGREIGKLNPKLKVNHILKS